MDYANPITTTYRFPAVSVTGAATLGRIQGPKGKRGRIVDVGAVTTTATTVAATNLIVGSVADTDAYATLPIPVTAINLGLSNSTKGVELIIPADTLVLVGSAGGATAGAVDALVTIAWF